MGRLEVVDVIEVGIDPGKNGGFAICDGKRVWSERMPETEPDIVGLIREIVDGAQAEGQPLTFYVEDVPKFVGKFVPSSSSFVLGRNFGVLLGSLYAMRCRVVLLRPQEWQRRLGLGTSRGMKSSAWKNKLKERAQQLFPAQKVTLATADALLILEAGQQGAGDQ